MSDPQSLFHLELSDKFKHGRHDVAQEPAAHVAEVVTRDQEALAVEGMPQSLIETLTVDDQDLRAVTGELLAQGFALDETESRNRKIRTVCG